MPGTRPTPLDHMVVDMDHALIPVGARCIARSPGQPYTQREPGLRHCPIPLIRWDFAAVDGIADDSRGVVAVGSGRVQFVGCPVGEAVHVVGCRGAGDVDGGEAGVCQNAGSAGGAAAVADAGSGDASWSWPAGGSRSLARSERFGLKVRGVFGNGCSVEEGDSRSVRQ